MATSMKNATSTQLTTIPRALPAVNKVWFNTVPETKSEKEPGLPTVKEGPFIKGMDRLVKVLERRIDRQILAAQIRAYDDPTVPPARSQHLQDPSETNVKQPLEQGTYFNLAIDRALQVPLVRWNIRSWTSCTKSRIVAFRRYHLQRLFPDLFCRIPPDSLNSMLDYELPTVTYAVEGKDHHIVVFPTTQPCITFKIAVIGAPRQLAHEKKVWKHADQINTGVYEVGMIKTYVERLEKKKAQYA